MSDGRVMKGVRVIEIAQFVFAPTAAALLADWGADVLKIERPKTGDAQRGYRRWDQMTFDTECNPLIENPNRGKRSVGIDLTNSKGREVLYELVKTADVFITNFLPGDRQRLEIDLEHIRAANAKIIYARASAYGVRGEEAGRGGFDGTVFWSHCGLARTFTPPELDGPLEMTVGGMGDMISGMNMAGGIAAALFRRAMTGEPGEVDVSLMSTAWWAAGAAVVATLASGQSPKARMPRSGSVPNNPFVGNFKTSDGAIISLFVMQPGPFIHDTFAHLGLGELADDPRFLDGEALMQHTAEASALIVEAFAAHPLDYWRERLKTMGGAWAVPRDLKDLATDPQALANDMLFEVETAEGKSVSLTRGPVQFDSAPVVTTRAPSAWEHTEEVLLELGYGWPDIERLKVEGAIV